MAQDGPLNLGFEDGVLSPWSAGDLHKESITVITGDEETSVTYEELDITVSPDVGSHMLRLATPKQISENMNIGSYTVSQSFTPTSDSIVLSFRVFSWEHRDTRDTFTIDVSTSDPSKHNITVQDKDGGNLSVTMFADQPTQSCSTTPCVLKLSSGKRGDLVDTKWKKIIVSGLLPTDGSPASEVTISYSLDGIGDEAHPSWAYVDSWNIPPISKFSVSRPNTVEGNIITLVDTSKAYGEDNTTTRNKWEICNSNYNPSCKNIYNTGEIILNSPDEGPIKATLTVTDKYGDSDTSVSGTFARDFTFIPAINYVNGNVYASVLNYEILKTDPTDPKDNVVLLGRFIDPGWEDQITVSWDVGEGTIVGEPLVEVEQVPMLLTGITQATYTPPTTSGTYNGSLTVYDNDGGNVTKPFTIEVINPDKLNTDEGRREPNNTLEQAHELKSGWAYLSNLHEKGDVDLFKVVLPNGDPIPNASSILIKLSNLPQDYDLIVLRRPLTVDTTPSLAFSGFGSTPTTSMFSGFGATPVMLFSGFGSTPVMNFFSGFGSTPSNNMSFFSGFGSTPTTFLFSGFGSTPNTFMFSGFGSTPMLFSGFGSTTIGEAMNNSNLKGIWLRDPRVNPFSNNELSFNHFPLSDMAFELPAQDEISSKDVNLSEVGLGNLEGSHLSLVAMSSNRGLKDEHLLLNTEGSDNEFIIAIVGNNGAFSSEPYRLQIETSVQMSAKTLVGENCIGNVDDIVVPTDKRTTFSELYNAGTTALLVVQPERYEAIYPGTWDNVFDKLKDLADKIGGTILAVPSDIYDEWDMNLCDSDKSNSSIAKYIRNEILQYVKSGTQFVTLIGNDKIIPFYRVPDATSISNEKNYALESRAIPGTPDFARLFESKNLTDDYYVDDNPFINDTSLFIPKWSISRLVENEVEITESISEFLKNNKNLNKTNAMVSGYDIFDDGAKESATYLEQLVNGGGVTKLISSTWTANDIGCELLGGAYAENCNDSEAVSKGISNFNAHFAHFFFQSADGYNKYDPKPDFMFSSDINSFGSGTQALSGNLTYTVGCHAGYNLPDGNAKEFASNTINPNLDFAQSVLKQGGVLIGSTGYGLAGIESVAGTEKLLALFSEELVKNRTVGEALVKAKQRYFTNLRSVSDVTSYDVKSSIQVTLYGLPMYSLQNEATLMSTTSTSSSSALANVSFNIIDSDGTRIPAGNNIFSQVDTASGSYYQVNNEHHSIPTRPVQPKKVLSIPTGLPVHGILVMGGIYTDELNFNPVYSRPTTEWSKGVVEKSYCQDGYWPSNLASINYFNNSPNLVVIPGQFSCTNVDPDTGIALGTQRLYDSIDLNVLRSADSTDFYPPSIESVDLQKSGNGTTAVVIGAVDNKSGISRIVALIQDKGILTPIDSGSLSGSGPYELDLGLDLSSEVNKNAKLILQVVDGANNVAYWTAKGKGIREIKVHLAEVSMYSNLSVKTLTATIPEFTSLLDKADSVSFIWDFGDTILESGLLVKDGVATDLIKLNPDGLSASFSVNHQYDTDYNLNAKLKITDSAGGIGSDEIQLMTCGDPSDFVIADGDLVQCDVTSSGENGTKINITVKVADGGVISPDFQYRLYLDYTNDGVSDLKLTYDNNTIGKTNKLDGLTASVSGDKQSLLISFDLAPTGWTKDMPLNWYMETQSGVEKGKTIGSGDSMPDTGYFSY